ncbi:MAG TPA: serine hydrolase domain-containing protein [Gemmatimonadaceae bacterium]|nr:serine hydrolase domain-containing protein [Gemmatimonadaceae bacterium]
MRKRLFLFLMVAASAAPLTVAAQRSPRLAACRDQRQSLKDAVADIQRRQRNVGLSALVMLGGETVIAENLGYADLEHRVPVTSETRFGVASITKAFTGLGLLKLHETGRIDLDAPIQRYVPAFPEKKGGVITARLLAAHLAGIRHWGQERNAALYARHFDDVNDVLALFKDDTLVAPPGTKASYSSYGYNLIAAAMQSASGVKYQEYVNREIISKLGLRDTGFDDVRRVLPHRARRYSYFDPWTFAVDSNAVFRVPDWDYSHNMAGGNMYATAADLARFGRAIERPGLLSNESIDLLNRVLSVGTVRGSMSFGFFVSDSTAPHRLLNIGGSNAGLQSGLFVYPDEDLVVAVLANTWGIGSNSGEMNSVFPSRLAAICMGWPQPPPVK